MNELLRACPLVIAEDVAWGDMDAYLHVNNTVYFRWFESARMGYLYRSGLLDALQTAGLGPIVSTTQCRFRAPLAYPDRIEIAATVAKVDADRLTMRYAITSEALGRLAAEGEAVIVCYDYATRTKAVWPPAALECIRAFEATAGAAPRRGTTTPPPRD